MSSLAGTYGGSGWRRLARVGAGVGLVLGGAAAFGLGLLDVVTAVGSGLGFSPGVARRLGLTMAMPVVPVALVALRRRLPSGAGAGPIAAGSVAVGLAVVLVWIAGAVVIAAVYAFGVLLVLAGVLAGPVASGRVPTGSSASGFAGFSRSPSRGPMPADGGRDEDRDLSFPLDEEE